eukprot:jgi/Mesvir1/23932/Mv10707-RA.1
MAAVPLPDCQVAPTEHIKFVLRLKLDDALLLKAARVPATKTEDHRGFVNVFTALCLRVGVVVQWPSTRECLVWFSSCGSREDASKPFRSFARNTGCDRGRIGAVAGVCRVHVLITRAVVISLPVCIMAVGAATLIWQFRQVARLCLDLSPMLRAFLPCAMSCFTSRGGKGYAA